MGFFCRRNRSMAEENLRGGTRYRLLSQLSDSMKEAVYLLTDEDPDEISSSIPLPLLEPPGKKKKETEFEFETLPPPFFDILFQSLTLFKIVTFLARGSQLSVFFTDYIKQLRA